VKSYIDKAFELHYKETDKRRGSGTWFFNKNSKFRISRFFDFRKKNANLYRKHRLFDNFDDYGAHQHHVSFGTNQSRLKYKIGLIKFKYFNILEKIKNEQ
jgi:hypothetical protein